MRNTPKSSVHAVAHINRVLDTYEQKALLAAQTDPASSPWFDTRNAAVPDIRTRLDNNDYKGAVSSLKYLLRDSFLSNLLAASLTAEVVEGDFDSPLAAALAGILNAEVQPFEHEPVTQYATSDGLPTVQTLVTYEGQKLLIHMSSRMLSVFAVHHDDNKMTAGCSMVSQAVFPWMQIDLALFRVNLAVKTNEACGPLAMRVAKVIPGEDFLWKFNVRGDEHRYSLSLEDGQLTESMWMMGAGGDLSKEQMAEVFEFLSKEADVDVRAALRQSAETVAQKYLI